MPLIFIHGVNVRDYDKDYLKNCKTRERLIKHYLLEPLAAKGSRFKQIDIVNSYWGKYGVNAKWQFQSLPSVKILEHLGGNTLETPKSDFELQQLLTPSESESSQLEHLGGNKQRLKTSASKDLTRFIEVVLLPIIYSEMNLIDEAEEEPEREGELEALLAVAGLEVATNSDIKQDVEKANTDEEVIELLTKKVQERFEELVLSSNLVSSKDLPLGNERLERLGQRRLPRWLQEVNDRIGELFDRSKNVHVRALTIGVLQQFREDLHLKISRFLGDVFVYLNERGSNEKPGPIISTVLEYINIACQNKHHSNEPLIVITHSMGGNILYDILTYYQPTLQVDVWVSVGGQVGNFEEMKIFKASNKDIGIPYKVESLKEKVGYWLNVYDPADIFSFKAAPIFVDVQDVEYLTGASLLQPHDTYFKRPSFYRMLYQHLEQALL
jgi:hypothetical protein